MNAVAKAIAAEEELHPDLLDRYFNDGRAPDPEGAEDDGRRYPDEDLGEARLRRELRSAPRPANRLRAAAMAMAGISLIVLSAVAILTRDDAAPSRSVAPVAAALPGIPDGLPRTRLLLSPVETRHAVLLRPDDGTQGLIAEPVNLSAAPDAHPVLWQVDGAGVTRRLAELGAGMVHLPGATLAPGQYFLVTLEPDAAPEALPRGPIVMQAATPPGS